MHASVAVKLAIWCHMVRGAAHFWPWWECGPNSPQILTPLALTLTFLPQFFIVEKLLAVLLGGSRATTCIVQVASHKAFSRLTTR
jgi:hypothetical protein